MVDITKNPYKCDFPLLAEREDLHFLDSAATAQRPRCVIDAQKKFYETCNANALRGLYSLSVTATNLINEARQKIAAFIGASDAREVIFTKNTSESLNLAAASLSNLLLSENDEVVISVMEHHSNLIPWQRACKEHGAKLIYLYPDKEGHITDAEIEAKITDKCKIVSIMHVSNVMGCELPVKKIAARAHEMGAICIVDGAQSVPHLPIDVKDLACDLFAFSAHKVFGPLGIGILWGRRGILESMPPFLTGGEMIDSVSETDATWAQIPEKFEAGTQDAAGIYATGIALDYVQQIGRDKIKEREDALVKYMFDNLSALPYITIYGPSKASEHHGVVTFNIDGIHPHDVASLLDTKNVCVRAGHHCAQPLMNFLQVGSTTRASIALYNDKDDIDAFIDGIKFVWEVFNGK